MNNLSRPGGEPPRALIGPDEPTVFEILNQEGRAALQLVSDHASAAVPAALGQLGLDDSHFGQHIAYDIGTADIIRGLAVLMDAPAVLTGYSRLVIDVNRPPGHPQSIPDVSDGIKIPGNQGLSEEDQKERVAAVFEPYHDAIHESIAHLWRRDKPPALFSIHSFTPDFGDEDRPWDVGVLWNRDPRIAKPLIEKLTSQGLNVGDNLPYSGRELAYTINLHGGAAGLANCVVEINQDQVKDQQGVERWVEILAGVMGDILRLEGLHQVREF